jgi:hypothetical protein
MTVSQPPRIQLAAHELGRSQTAQRLCTLLPAPSFLGLVGGRYSRIL